MKKLLYALVFTTSAAFAQDRTEVFFAFDRYGLDPAGQQKLDAWVTDNPKAEVAAIYGYCDKTGTLAYNDSLSVRRARAVADFLKSRNAVLASNCIVKGYGEDFPLSKNHRQNRKVVLWYRLPQTDMPQSKLGQKVKAAAVGDKIRLENINFYNMSDRIVPKSEPLLQDLLAVMRDNPNLKIEIQGHICCQTAKQKDYSYVSTMRAKAVYDYLLGNGIGRVRLAYKGFGISRPIHPIPEKNDRQADENRRVEIEVISNQ